MLVTKKQSSGNMYPWIGITRNYLGGECPHACVYCYVSVITKRFGHLQNKYSGLPRLIESELRKNEGQNQMIFVQSCGDLFAESIPCHYIERVLEHCCEYPENNFLYQSKNSERFIQFIEMYPPQCIFGTTLESNRDYENISKAPRIESRIRGLIQIRDHGYEVMVSVEPILDFALDDFIKLLKRIKPRFVSIGADSKRKKLPEPGGEEIIALIEALKQFTEVKLKDNLKRLLLINH